MFALKKRNVTVQLHIYCCLLYNKKNKFVLDYEDVYHALMLVDYLKSLI